MATIADDNLLEDEPAVVGLEGPAAMTVEDIEEEEADLLLLGKESTPESAVGKEAGSEPHGSETCNSLDGQDDILDLESSGWAEQGVVMTTESDDELDYEELLDVEHGQSEDDGLSKELSEEDVVKVHIHGGIEEGELSSDEEGEIKDDEEEPVTKTTNCKMAEFVDTVEQGSDVASISKPPPSPEDKKEKEEEADEVKEEKDKEIESASEGKKESSLVKTTGEDKQEREMPSRDSRFQPFCRHFINGKCSWGASCRFRHALPEELGDGETPVGLPADLPPGHPLRVHGPPPHLRGPHPPGYPPYVPDLPPYMHPPGFPQPGHSRGLPSLPPHGVIDPGFHPRHLPIPHHRMNVPPHGPYPHFGGPPDGAGLKTSQVAEENAGWVRLRTVTDAAAYDSESDDQEGVEDLRDKLKRKRTEEETKAHSEECTQKQENVMRSEDWTDPWARQQSIRSLTAEGEKEDSRKREGKKGRKRKSDGESEGESLSGTEAKRRTKKTSGSGRKAQQLSGRGGVVESSSEDNTRKKKMRRKSEGKKRKKEDSKKDDSSLSDSSGEEDVKREQSTRRHRRTRKDSSSDSKDGGEKDRKTKKRRLRHSQSTAEDAGGHYSPPFHGRHFPSHGHWPSGPPAIPLRSRAPFLASMYTPRERHYNPDDRQDHRSFDEWCQFHHGHSPSYSLPYPPHFSAPRGRRGYEREPMDLGMSGRVTPEGGGSRKWRHHDSSGEESPEVRVEGSPDSRRSRRRQASHKRQHSQEKLKGHHERRGRSLSKREKLMHELEVVERHIERKKSKKRKHSPDT